MPLELPLETFKISSSPKHGREFLKANMLRQGIMALRKWPFHIPIRVAADCLPT